MQPPRLLAGSGQVRCTAVAAGSTDAGGNQISLILSISPIGDYSTYGLELTFDPARIDPTARNRRPDTTGGLTGAG